jgi:hypothetical protein
MRRIGDRSFVTTTVMHALVIMACIVLLSSTGCSGAPSSGSENRQGSAPDSRGAAECSEPLARVTACTKQAWHHAQRATSAASVCL